MRFLVDSDFPANVAVEAPLGIELMRWSGEAIGDVDLVREAEAGRFEGVVFSGVLCFQQPGVVEAAEENGVHVVAVDGRSPLAAKQQLLGSVHRLRSFLRDHRCAVVKSGKIIDPLDGIAAQSSTPE